MDSAIRLSYSSLADRYIEVCGSLGEVDPADLEFLERNLGDCDGVVIDAGCGPGHLTEYLTDLGVATRGIDLVPEFIEYARSRRPDIDYQVGSMHTLDLPDGSLHGILTWFSLIHCDPSELADAFTRLRRALHQDGTLVVGFFEGDRVEPFEHKVTTAYRWPIDDMNALLAAAGFTEVDRCQRAATEKMRAVAALAVRPAPRAR
ncbi:class I SAM-dependent methyltransferase [Antrihabitans cavernicola]|uniref:Methyltransferase domain-containing protein n=1 Tax=Antrihabitans cavernicola TaxID=2495913 RepID=A0A5A7SDE7_9NOCA|nr:class I SAM-dependent methyltransferase [Spelaeibacter cavernicola]KAA0023946.1 methyltransferase domain-containing protein [Spelaeibacter cavernicola]